MFEDAIWQRKLIAALHLESLFISEQFGSPSADVASTTLLICKALSGAIGMRLQRPSI
jgi:hypothetical protein